MGVCGMDMTYEEMLREMDAYRAASAQAPTGHSLTRHEEMLERLCKGAGEELQDDTLLAALRKRFTAEEAETWLLCPVFSKNARPMAYGELRECCRPELRPQLLDITDKLLKEKVLLQVKHPMGSGFFARCDAHCIRTLESAGSRMHSTSASAGLVKVAAELCVGCKLCAKACPVNAVQVQGKSVTIDGALCMGCGACVRKCPKKALKM